MTPAQMEQAAMKRIRAYIGRSVAQHLRWHKEKFAKDERPIIDIDESVLRVTDSFHNQLRRVLFGDRRSLMNIGMDNSKESMRNVFIDPSGNALCTWEEREQILWGMPECAFMDLSLGEKHSKSLLDKLKNHEI